MYCFNNFQLTTTSLYHFTCIKYKTIYEYRGEDIHCEEAITVGFKKVEFF